MFARRRHGCQKINSSRVHLIRCNDAAPSVAQPLRLECMAMLCDQPTPGHLPHRGGPTTQDCFVHVGRITKTSQRDPTIGFKRSTLQRWQIARREVTKESLVKIDQPLAISL